MGRRRAWIAPARPRRSTLRVRQAKIAQSHRRLRIVFADGPYARNGLPDSLRKKFGWIPHTALRRVRARGFVILPKRWIIERTFAWLMWHRRHARDDERNIKNSASMIYIAIIRIVGRRLARKIQF